MEIHGERWGNRRETPHDYETVFGTVPLERAVYQQSGRGRVAVPLDLRLGMVEGTYTPRLARIATRALAGMPEQEAADLLAEVGTATLSNSTIGRLSRAMAARYEQRREVIATAVRERHIDPRAGGHGAGGHRRRDGAAGRRACASARPQDTLAGASTARDALRRRVRSGPRRARRHHGPRVARRRRRHAGLLRR